MRCKPCRAAIAAASPLRHLGAPGVPVASSPRAAGGARLGLRGPAFPVQQAGRARLAALATAPGPCRGVRFAVSREATRKRGLRFGRPANTLERPRPGGSGAWARRSSASGAGRTASGVPPAKDGHVPGIPVPGPAQHLGRRAVLPRAAEGPAPCAKGDYHRQAARRRCRPAHDPAACRALARQAPEQLHRGAEPAPTPAEAAKAAARASAPCAAVLCAHACIHNRFQPRRHRLTAGQPRAARGRPSASGARSPAPPGPRTPACPPHSSTGPPRQPGNAPGRDSTRLRVCNPSLFHAFKEPAAPPSIILRSVSICSRQNDASVRRS